MRKTLLSLTWLVCLGLVLGSGGDTSRTRVIKSGILDSLGVVKDAGKWAQKAVKVAEKTDEATTDITPEQEYYIGRAVAASILAQYRPYKNDMTNAYVNLLGQSLAAYSEQPQTFGGYHFQIVDSPEINAFAAPGGLIMVCRGLVRVCGDEAELAAVLAHEIGHVQQKHGLSAIKKNRLMNLGGMLVKEGTQEFGGARLNQLTDLFGETVGDITKTLMQSGYSRDQEGEADRAAAAILARAGYDPAALAGMLKKMKKSYPADKVGFAKTHPDPLDRIEDLGEAASQTGEVRPAPPVRNQRFLMATKGV